MHGRQDRDRLAGHIDAGEDLGALRDAGQALVQDLRVEMVQMQVDVVDVYKRQGLQRERASGGQRAIALCDPDTVCVALRIYSCWMMRRGCLFFRFQGRKIGRCL